MNNTVIKTNDLSFYNDYGTLTLSAKQYDTGRKFKFRIMNDLIPFDLNNYSCYLRAKKADGTEFQSEECCIIDGCNIIVDTSLGNGNQLLTSDGFNLCELHLTDFKGLSLTTCTFIIDVEKRVHNGDNLNSVDSWDRLDYLKEIVLKLNKDFTNHIENISNPHDVNKKQLGLGNVENKSSETIRNEITYNNIVNAIGYSPLDSNLKGNKNGLAELDSNGKVPTSQLPSYVDDVVEGYYYNSKFYKESSHTTLITGETDKIYVDTTYNKTYRWSGSSFVVISETLALGETSSTAYRGDRGKIAYNHSQSIHARTDATLTESSTTNGNIKINGTEISVYKHPGSGTNPHGTTKNDIGLGNVPNVTTNDQIPTFEQAISRENIVSGEKLSSILGKIMKWLSDLKSVAFSGNYNDLTNTPSIPYKTSELSNDSGFITLEDIDDSQNHIHQNKSILDNITQSTLDKINSIEDTNTTYSLNKINGKIILIGSDGTSTEIDDSDTIYTHPTTAGYKHIPSGGSSGQALIFDVNGTAKWSTLTASSVGALPVNGNAVSATTATSATKDSNGNIITNTYVTKTEFNSTIGNINSMLDSINRTDI